MELLLLYLFTHIEFKFTFVDEYLHESNVFVTDEKKNRNREMDV